MNKYVCEPCGYVYDPKEGDPDNGIEPGTAFEDLPEDWVCPLCGLGKDVFVKETAQGSRIQQGQFAYARDSFLAAYRAALALIGNSYGTRGISTVRLEYPLFWYSPILINQFSKGNNGYQ